MTPTDTIPPPAAPDPSQRRKTDQERSPWLRVDEARAIAKCGAKLLYREIKAGRLRAARVGGRRDIHVHRDWLGEWLTKASEPVEVRR